MFGIGLPEMIVIMAVALIVVGPDKLPDMARSVAKWVLELKKTVNQVKESLADEDNLIGSVQSDLRKTGNDLKGELLDSDDFTWHEPGGPKNAGEIKPDEVLDIEKQAEGLSGDEMLEVDSGIREAGATDSESESEAEEKPPKSSP
jgi:sec-independent protein translocase protein TatB